MMADSDGVIVIRKVLAAQTVERAQARMLREEELARRIRMGEAQWNLVGAADNYEKLGVEEIDVPWAV